MRHPLRPAAFLASLLLFSGCSTQLDVPAGARISCASSADCPSGFTCRATLGQCVAVDDGDATAPGVVQVSIAIGASVVKAGDLLTVAFDVSEALLGPPDVQLDVGGGERRALALDAALTNAGALHYAYTYTVVGDEAETDAALTARLVDRSGNVAQGQPLGFVKLDFSPPAVVVSSVALLPGPSNPLARPAAAGPGTEVVVSIVPHERLGDAPAPTLAVTGPGSATLPFVLDTGESSDALAVFTATVPAGAPDGEYGAVVTWTDRVGNSTTAAVPSPFVVRTSAPLLSVDQAAIRFVRSPWGAGAPEALGAFVQPAGPFFGIAPADPLSTAAVLPASAFSLAAGRPLVKVRVWASSGKTTLLGDLEPVAGGWERKPLDARDTEFAWVTGVDDAGNESAPVQVKASEWIATANPPAFGRPVHEVTATAAASAALVQTPVGMTAAELGAVAGLLAAPDDGGTVAGRSLAVASSPSWRETPRTASPLPSGRAAARTAWDPVRRTLVLFGGSASPGSSADAFDDTWEWDGARWTERAPAGAPPPRRSGHVLFFHPGRGTVVLFGGGGSFCLDDLWEWDGVRWSPIDDPSPEKPINCGRGAAAWDGARNVLVYWGGESADLWTWDGARWTKQPAAGGPTERREPSMAFDPQRAAVVMYGGYDPGTFQALAETWEWDGAWHLRKAASAPGARYGTALAWDPSRGRVVMVGGRDFTGSTYGDVWTWGGTDWSDATPAGPGPSVRADHALAWDDATGSLVLVGGQGEFSQLLPAETWRLGAAGWSALPSTISVPAARAYHAMAADPAGGGVLLFGGAVGNNPLGAAHADTWRHAGSTWTQLSPATSPTGRVGHAMAPAAGGVALFGGAGPGGAPVYQNDLWRWNGATWALAPPLTNTGRPPARTGAGLAYDEARGRLVMFGGSNGSALGDVWEHDGSGWVNRTPATGPSPGPRAYHGMVYDPDLQRVLVLGGCDNPQDAFARCANNDFADVLLHQPGDVWAWNGSAWTLLAGPSPAAVRSNFGSAWAPAQHRTVVFGGYDGHTTYGDPAELDGLWWPSGVTTGAPATLGNAMGYDATSGRVITFGGIDAGLGQESWEWVAPPGRQPAVQLTVSTAPAAIDPSTVEAVRVRAVCGGVFAPYAAGSTGAALWGWSQTGGALATGGWRKLAAATGGFDLAGGVLQAPAASRLDWTSASAAEARGYLLTARDVAAFQCRPDGAAVNTQQRGVEPVNGFGEAVVAADYLEVRIRYRAP